MKRYLVAGAIVLAVLGGLLGGCSPSAAKDGTGGSTSASATQGHTPAVGASSLGAFVPGPGFTLSDGIADVGNVVTGGVSSPAIVSPSAGTNWPIEKVEGASRRAVGAVQVGTSRVIVGNTGASAGAPGGGIFAATSDNGGAFSVTDLSSIVGAAAELRGLASSGEPNDGSSVLVAVGGMAIGHGNKLGDLSKTAPLVIVSADRGKTWAMAGALPIPKNVTGVEAMAVALAPHSTAYQGMIVVGQGWVSSGSKPGQGRDIALVWASPDKGKHWLVISDNSFYPLGKDILPRFVASDGATIVVVGSAATTPSGASKSYETVEWIADPLGSWHFGKLPVPTGPGQSSVPTGLISRESGGYLLATQVVGSAPTSRWTPPLDAKDATVNAFFSRDGNAWSDDSSGIPGLGSAQSVSGVAEFGSRVAFFGVDKAGGSHAWVVEPSGP